MKIQLLSFLFVLLAGAANAQDRGSSNLQITIHPEPLNPYAHGLPQNEHHAFALGSIAPPPAKPAMYGALNIPPCPDEICFASLKQPLELLGMRLPKEVSRIDLKHPYNGIGLGAQIRF